MSDRVTYLKIVAHTADGRVFEHGAVVGATPKVEDGAVAVGAVLFDDIITDLGERGLL